MGSEESHVLWLGIFLVLPLDIFDNNRDFGYEVVSYETRFTVTEKKMVEESFTTSCSSRVWFLFPS